MGHKLYAGFKCWNILEVFSIYFIIQGNRTRIH